MNKTFQCAVIILSLGAAAVLPAAEPAPPAAQTGAPAASASAPPAPATAPGSATTPAGSASPKAPSTAAPTQAAGPDRIEPTEKVRADSEVSFPVDI